MGKDPAFLFYPNDWAGGTMGMTLEEKGAYIEVLVLQWNYHGNTIVLPNGIPTQYQGVTIDKIKRVLGDRFAAVWPMLQGKFPQVEGAEPGILANPRLAEEMAKRRAHSEKQRQNIAKRWDKNREYGGNTTVLPTQGITTVIPLGNGNGNENGNKGKKRRKERGVGETIEGKEGNLVYPFTDAEFLARWDAWKKYKREQHAFSYKPTGEQAALKHLGELAAGNLQTALAIIDQSLAQGWKGFFQLKNQPNNGTVESLESRYNRLFGTASPADSENWG